MSDRSQNHELNPIAAALPDHVQQGCYKAQLLRTAVDIPPATIPEDFEAASFKGYKCELLDSENKACQFADPMVFLKRDIGFTAMGHTNFCELESESPRKFKRAALGHIGVRAARFARELSAYIRDRSSS